MKKSILLLCMAAALAGCSGEILDTGKDNTQQEGGPMTFNLTVLETKAPKTGWADGDKIYVFFNGLANKYLVLERDGSGWTNSSGGGALLPTDFSVLGTKTLTAVHFPVAVDVAYADGKFSFTSGGKPVYNYYLFETDKPYTLDGGTEVTATLSLNKPADMVQIYVEGIAPSKVADYTFGCSKIRPVACTAVFSDGSISEKVLQAGARLSGVAEDNGCIFAGRLVWHGAEKNYTFTIASDTQLYTLTRSGRTLFGGLKYYFPPLTAIGGDNWTVQNASDLYVDLGIEVDGKKIYWAKCNLGADSETDYGDYFAWGEVTGTNEGKANFADDGSTYYFGTYPFFTKYTGSDLSMLEKEDDAAYAALGGKFRMPTKAEIEALAALPQQWVTESGIVGVKFTGNGNTLFFPAASYWMATNFEGAYAGVYGYYLTSSYDTPPDTHLAHALMLDINTENAYSSYAYRPYGHSVRPVFVDE